MSVVHEFDNEDLDRIAEELKDPETLGEFLAWVRENESTNG
jgi:hypothetical protein